MPAVRSEAKHPFHDRRYACVEAPDSRSCRWLGEDIARARVCAHMGHINALMILGTLGVIEMALTALRIPHGTGGVDAAVRYLGDSVPA